MTSKLNNQSSARNATAAGRPPTANYAPSVPISLYRQLSAELQTTKASLESLTAQNQQLVRQNQQLRSEIEKVVHSTLQLQQVADSFQPATTNLLSEATQPVTETPVDPSQVTSSSAAQNRRAPKTDPDESVLFSQELLVGQESQPRRPSSSEKASGLNGWKLSIIILLIVITAFGAGFAIVRPFLRR